MRTTLRSPAGALLAATSAPRRPAGVAIVLHGGDETRSARCRWWYPAVLRCRLLAWDLALRWRRRPIAVYRLQHVRTGWQGDGASQLADLDWALAEVDRVAPVVPVVLVGHSMGGRTAAQRAGRPRVTGVVGLAPWLPDKDPVDQLDGRLVDVVAGTRDSSVPPTGVFIDRAERAGAVVGRYSIAGGGHMMVRHIARWQRTAARLAEAQLTVAT